MFRLFGASVRIFNLQSQCRRLVGLWLLPGSARLPADQVAAHVVSSSAQTASLFCDNFCFILVPMAGNHSGNHTLKVEGMNHMSQVMMGTFGQMMMQGAMQQGPGPPGLQQLALMARRGRGGPRIGQRVGSVSSATSGICTAAGAHGGRGGARRHLAWCSSMLRTRCFGWAGPAGAEIESSQGSHGSDGTRGRPALHVYRSQHPRENQRRAARVQRVDGARGLHQGVGETF